MKQETNSLIGKIAIVLALPILYFSLIPISFAEEPSSLSGTPIPAEIFSLNIKPGSAIKGSVDMKVKVPYAQGIEVVLIPINSKIPILTSQAKKIEENYWSISFSLKKVPKGDYYLLAKIKNPLGEFETGKVKVTVDNSSKDSKPITQKDIDEWEKEVNSADNKLLQDDIDEFLDFSITPEWLDEYFHTKTCSDKNLCGAQADPDNDGLVNFEELRFKTNPTVSDTDGDGYTDGDEIKGGYDPLKSSPGHINDKIIFESPKENGAVESDIYKILNVVSAKINANKTSITLSGTGLPNSFVNVYVYSSPTVLTVKTDDTGSWSYTLDKEIGDGQHQVYVAVTDNAGKITAKSEPLFFVKKAEAISIIPPSEASSAQLASPTENRQTSYIFIATIIAGIALLLSLIIIGLRMSKNIKEKPEQTQ